jgi:hypothetical protein
MRCATTALASDWTRESIKGVALISLLDPDKCYPVRGELTRAILDVLRDAQEPLPTREIARSILAVNEQDPRDRRLLTEHTRRVSKALRVLKQRFLVVSSQNIAGEHTWASRMGTA